MKIKKCSICNKEIQDNEIEEFHLSINNHPKTSKFIGSTTYFYILCYDCNNYLGNLLTVYFGNMLKFRNSFKIFVDVYAKIYLIMNNNFNVNIRYNWMKFKSKFYKG